MILATIQFPNGSQIFLGDDGRWAGSDSPLADAANEGMRSLPARYRPDWARNIAEGVAAELGGTVISTTDSRDALPGDATP